MKMIYIEIENQSEFCNMSRSKVPQKIVGIKFYHFINQDNREYASDNCFFNGLSQPLWVI